ncbi:hypothetical protein ACTL6U_07665 [Rhodovibrionaceae bacterium A322]
MMGSLSRGGQGRFRALRWLGLGVGLLALAGCTSEPTPTNPPKAMVASLKEKRQLAEGRGQNYPPTRLVSLCYSAQVDRKDQIESYLANRCPASEKWQIRLYGEDQLGTNCPLLQGVRITFICTKPAG